MAIALDEPEADTFGEIIGSEPCVIGWPTVFECHQVLASIPHRRGLDVLDKIMSAPRLEVVSFDRRAFGRAAEAFDLYGRGRHPAKLNFGDCMAYAIARVHDATLLYKGTNFGMTDVKSAFP